MKRQINHRKRLGARTRRQRGVVLVAALVCLLIVTTMLGQMLLSVVRSGRQLHLERDRRQCELLLQAGIERAAHRAARDAEYSGETWRVPAADLLGQGDGEVKIEPVADENGSAARLHIVAEYPVGSEHSVRRSRTIELKNEATSTEEK